MRCSCRAMRTLNALLLALLFTCAPTSVRGSMWMDPGWEEMLKESELIVLVEASEGGKFFAKVRPVKAFKGTPPKEFYVTGFSNHNWPKHATKIESFVKNHRYYLFLQRREDALPSLEFHAQPDGVIGFIANLGPESLGRQLSKREFRAPMAAAKEGRVWSVWTPSAGDLPVDGDKVRYSLLSPSYPHHSPARSCSDFERFLAAAVAFHGGQQPDAALAADALEAVREEAAKGEEAADPSASGENDEGSELSHQLAVYYLIGGRAYDMIFEQIATGKDVNARFMLARLLSRVREEPAQQLLARMLNDGDSTVQGEVVRQLAKGNAEQVGPLLHAHLAGASDGAIGPSGLMDPVRNVVAGGKVEIVRALGELRYAPAAADLIRVLENAEDTHLLRTVLEALDKMGNRDYPRALERPLRRNDRNLMMTAAYWVRDHRLVELKAVLADIAENPPPLAVGGPHSVAIEALGVVGDEESGARLTALLNKLTSRPMPEFFDQGVIASVIGALAALRHQPARGAVEEAFFYWFGVDSTFAGKPELLKVKRGLEKEIEADARDRFREFFFAKPRALVFLLNRRELAAGSATRPEYRSAIHVDIHSLVRMKPDAATLKPRLDDVARKYHGVASVTRWVGCGGEGSEGCDWRISQSVGTTFFSNYARYVHATRAPQDLHFVEFLLRSGLADQWQARNELAAALQTTPIE